MENLDINGNKRKWERIRDLEFSSGKVDGLSPHNSKLCISLLKDFENGLNVSSKGERTPASLMRIRLMFRTFSKLYGKSKDMDKISQADISTTLKKGDSESLTRNVKAIYRWMERTKRIKTNPSEHILTSDYSKGKAAWVYLGEEGMRKLINSLGFKQKALTCLLYDSGMRAEEGWRIRVSDFQDDFHTLDIPEKRANGDKVAKKKSFGRKIKLKMCSELIKEYVSLNNLKGDDLLFDMTQAGYNKSIRVVAKKLFGTEPTKAREKPIKITAGDIRHNAACFWLKRYKKNSDLMYRFGWKGEDKIFYYSEFMDMRDTIDDEDLVTQEDKTRYETEIRELKKKLEVFQSQQTEHTQDIDHKLENFKQWVISEVTIGAKGKRKQELTDESLEVWDNLPSKGV